MNNNESSVLPFSGRDEQFKKILKHFNNVCYYSFKIFPQFWLAKSTRLIHHNQLLMTKFGRILTLTRKWRQKCSVFAGWGTVNREDLGTMLSCFGCELKKMADISLVSRVRTTAGTRRNNNWKHGKNSKKTTRRATSAIWRIFMDLDKPKCKLSKINLTSMQVSLF